MIRMEGYAVVCDNDCIADASGHMPDALKAEAEWAFFQAGLEASDVIVLGRKSHDMTPNPKARRRLVMTRQVETPVWEDDRTVLWNPEKVSLQMAISMFDFDICVLAVTGGREVFDYFLGQGGGYSAFHLSRIKDVYLRGGVKVFSDLEGGGVTPESLLQSGGYLPAKWRELDDVSSVVTWVPAMAD